MAKIWFISEFYYPVVVSTGYYVTEIAEYLANQGKEVGVICTNNTYYNTDVVSTDAYENHNGVDIYRFIGNKVKKDHLLKRALGLFYSSIALYKLAAKHIKEGDEVIILTNPAFLMLFMPKVRHITKCRYHILVHDIFPENLVSLGKFSNKSYIYIYLKRIFDNAYSKADSCISIGNDMTEVVRSKTKNDKPITQIANWADIDDLSIVNKKSTELYKEYDKELSDVTIFMFAGNLGKAQGLDNLLEAISLSENSKAKFLFIGAGAKADDIKQFAKKNEKVVFAGFRNRSQQNDFLNACDIGIVTLTEGMFGLGVPSKSYNLMATGKPILYIGESNSEIASCIAIYDIGWIVEPKNPQALKEMVDYIMLHPEEIPQKGLNALKVAKEIFAKPIVLEQYNRFFEQ